jgi:hypothetical protein
VRLKTAPENGDGTLLSDEEYGRQRFQLLKEKAHLEELFRDTGHRVEQWLTLVEKIFDFACSTREWFAAGDLAVKKEILSAISSNLTLRDKMLCVEAKKPFLILEQSLSRLPDERRGFEPQKNGSTTGQIASLQGISHSRLAQRDDVRTFARKKRNACTLNIPSCNEGKEYDWHVPLQALLLHVRECQTEYPQLNMALDTVFGMISAYQKEAA